MDREMGREQQDNREHSVVPEELEIRNKLLNDVVEYAGKATGAKMLVMLIMDAEGGIELASGGMVEAPFPIMAELLRTAANYCETCSPEAT